MIKSLLEVVWIPSPLGRGWKRHTLFLAVGGADTYSKVVALIPRPLGGWINFILLSSLFQIISWLLKFYFTIVKTMLNQLSVALKN